MDLIFLELGHRVLMFSFVCWFSYTVYYYFVSFVTKIIPWNNMKSRKKWISTSGRHFREEKKYIKRYIDKKRDSEEMKLMLDAIEFAHRTL